jgi:hypothetical protein
MAVGRNRYPGRCTRCGKTVPAGQGNFVRPPLRMAGHSRSVPRGGSKLAPGGGRVPASTARVGRDNQSGLRHRHRPVGRRQSNASVPSDEFGIGHEARRKLLQIHPYVTLLHTFKRNVQ